MTSPSSWQTDGGKGSPPADTGGTTEPADCALGPAPPGNFLKTHGEASEAAWGTQLGCLHLHLGAFLLPHLLVLLAENKKWKEQKKNISSTELLVIQRREMHTRLSLFGHLSPAEQASGSQDLGGGSVRGASWSSHGG